MLYVKFVRDSEEVYFAIATPVYVRRQKNGKVVRCDSPTLAQGVVSPDGSEIWHIADRPPMGEEYSTVERITAAEYEEWNLLREQAPDPEDTDPVIPEGVDPGTVLTRAELTVKVTELDEALQLLLSGVTEDD